MTKYGTAILLLTLGCSAAPSPGGEKAQQSAEEATHIYIVERNVDAAGKLPWGDVDAGNFGGADVGGYAPGSPY